jgi:UDP-glucose 4-epimerase
MKETHPVRKTPHFQYAIDKIEVEKLARKILNSRKGRNLILTTLRPCAIMGPDARNYIVSYMSHKIVPTLMGYDPLVQFVHIEDIREVCSIFLESDVPGIFNVVGSGAVTLSSLIQAQGKIGLPVYHALAYPLTDLFWYFRIIKSTSASLEFVRFSNLASNEKLKKTTGFSPRYSSKEAFQSYLEHERIQKYQRNREGKNETSLSEALKAYNQYLEKSEIETIRKIISQKDVDR